MASLTPKTARSFQTLSETPTTNQAMPLSIETGSSKASQRPR